MENKTIRKFKNTSGESITFKNTNITIHNSYGYNPNKFGSGDYGSSVNNYITLEEVLKSERWQEVKLTKVVTEIDSYYVDLEDSVFGTNEGGDMTEDLKQALLDMGKCYMDGRNATFGYRINKSQNNEENERV